MADKLFEINLNTEYVRQSYLDGLCESERVKRSAPCRKKCDHSPKQDEHRSYIA